MDRVMIIGAGVVGPLMAIYLARLGYEVDVYDRWADPRSQKYSAGKSINLTLCTRGLKALDRVGVASLLRKIAIPAHGRVVHGQDGSTVFQPYGNQGEAILSISRGEVCKTLLSCAEADPRIRLHFEEECQEIDLAGGRVRFLKTTTGSESESWVKSDRIFGADGAFSCVRMHLQRLDRFDYSQSYVPFGYKELHLPAAAGGGWLLDKNAIHIWPRGKYMLIGFANIDGSFTLSLHIPFAGEPSFESLRTEEDVLALFRADFPDVLPLMPDLVAEFFTRPVGSMVTIRCFPWTHEARVALIGDAAHAIVPSYGQGANFGFEGCAVFHDCLVAAGGQWRAAFEEYERRRKPEADAIADLAVEHFDEIQNLVGDPKFLLRKHIERRINELYPDRFAPLYSMISFTDMSYLEAQRIDREQQKTVDSLLALENIEDILNSRKMDHLIHEALR